MADETNQTELDAMRATIDGLHLRLTSLEGVLRNMSARLGVVEFPVQQPYVPASPSLVGRLPDGTPTYNNIPVREVHRIKSGYVAALLDAPVKATFAEPWADVEAGT